MGKRSNLGGYATMTSVAGKVGGPETLLLITLFSGYLIFKGGEVLVHKGFVKLGILPDDKEKKEVNSQSDPSTL